MSESAHEPAEIGAHLVSGGVEGVPAYRDLLANRDFRNLFYAMMVASLGDWVGVIAILEFTKTLLGPTRAALFALSGVMVARILPSLLLAPVAGVFADRWNRKRMMIVTNIGRGTVMALVPFAQDVFALFLATLVIETMSTLFIPAKDALMPRLVRRDQLVHANQLSLGAAYGPFPLGGALVALGVALALGPLSGWDFVQDRPLALPIWLNAATFFVSAVFIARVVVPPVDRSRQRRNGEEGPGAWQELVEGLRFIARNPMISSLIIGVMGASLAAGIVIGVGPHFGVVLGAGESGFGILQAVLGTGLGLGIASAVPIAQRFDKERLFAPGIAVAGVSLFATALMPRLFLAVIPAFVMGLTAGVSFITGYTMLQERSGDEIRGRTFGAFNSGVRLALLGALVVGPLIAGLIGPETDVDGYSIGGVRITLMAAGLVALASGVYSGRAISQRLKAEKSLRLSGHVDSVKRPGVFIAFEGGEGAGKSTQIQLLQTAVERSGREVVSTREPGGTAMGERVRAIVLDHASEALSDHAEALLYAAARAQHVDEVIRPALDRGAVVLCDRWIDSSVAYQGVGRGLGDFQIGELNRWATQSVVPDLIVLLDIEAEQGLERVGNQPDRLESAGLPFHQSVNYAFRRRAADDPTRYLVIDASRSIEEIHAQIREAVRLLVESHESVAAP